MAVVATRAIASDSLPYPVLVDETGHPVETVCILPLYRERSGLAVGPEGKGNAGKELLLMKPFRFGRGQDFWSLLASSRRNAFSLGLVFSYGTAHSLVRHLVLGPGYAPRLMTSDDTFEARTVLVSAPAPQAISVMDAITISSPDQHKLRAIFGVKEPIRIELSAEDIELLRSCIEGTRQGQAGG